MVNALCTPAVRYLFLHFGNLVHWNTKVQSIITTSSTAAEVIAVADSLDDLLTAKFFHFETMSANIVPTVYEDNISAFRTLKGGNTKKMRFPRILANQVCKAVENCDIQLEEVSGKNQLADGLTKSLPPILFKKFCNYFYTLLIDKK